MSGEAKPFLGREFLTWLVHRVETGGGRVEVAGEVTEVRLGDRLVLDGGPQARVTLVDPGDVGAELGAALRRGKLVDRASLVMVRGERRWELTLDGGMLAYEGLRCPKLGDRDRAAREDPRAAFENDLFLRLADLEESLAVLDRLFAEFCALRGAAAWGRTVLPALRAWAEELR